MAVGGRGVGVGVPGVRLGVGVGPEGVKVLVGTGVLLGALVLGILVAVDEGRTTGVGYPPEGVGGVYTCSSFRSPLVVP